VIHFILGRDPIIMLTSKKFLTACVLAAWIAMSRPASAQTLVWSEEFDGPAIDAGKWTFDVGGSGFGNAELQYYTARPENVFIENGALVIKAIREGYEGKQFTSARLKTHGRFAFKYGTLEARIKVPNLQNGLWPAFWLLGRNIGQNVWPSCGEIDILEMGDAAAIAAGTVNRKVSAAAHWDFMGSYAGYSGNTTSPVGLNGVYHTYSVSWTPSLITASLDGAQFWAIDISTIEANSLEEFHRPFFILVNLAVGGINFVQITDPAQITAPLPARLEVDWIRLYDNPHTELFFGEDEAESGNFGVFTETTPVNDAITFGTDAELYVWNNLTSVPVTPQEGSEAWSFNAGPGNWFGMGAFCLGDRNDNVPTATHATKTTTTHTIGFIASSAAARWLGNQRENFGLIRDGNWHEVVMP
jgi:beta-glucanase (GH16 family)